MSLTADKVEAGLKLSSATYTHVLEPTPRGFIFEREIRPSSRTGPIYGYSDHSMCATIYRLERTNEIFVSFRGSANHGNWVENIGFLRGTLPAGYQSFADEVVSEIRRDFSGREITRAILLVLL